MTAFDSYTEIARTAWVPACGGTEIPTLVAGRHLLYMWNPMIRKHAYYDMRADLFLTDEEARSVLP